MLYYLFRLFSLCWLTPNAFYCRSSLREASPKCCSGTLIAKRRRHAVLDTQGPPETPGSA